MSPAPGNAHPSWAILNSVPVETAESETTVSLRVGMMVVIFVISLFAASFPSLSRRVEWLAIPRIVFFIGKHFGTGVILSTAFVHLLQDAFESLQDPRVKERTQVGKWTGLIVLSSLLVIFLVEYTSTSFVDRLHSYTSNPSTPKTKALSLPTPDQENPSESTPLLPSSPLHRHSTTTSLPKSAPPKPEPPRSRSFFEGHHRHESRESHAQHGRVQHPRRGRLEPPSNVDEERGRVENREHGSGHIHHIHEHGHEHTHLDLEHSQDGDELLQSHSHPHHVEIGRKRQVVGILVLQLGIMLHSLVIGLTLSIASGADFTSLVIAIIFHQMFEGLSLGIRIAGLPASSSTATTTPPRISVLKTVLVVLFALTTPVGITIGLLTLGGSRKGVDPATLLLTEGLFSAVSAGMLIYAACVEMLAADFVLDPGLATTPAKRQVLAVVSLAAGAGGMAIVGLAG